jgi:hypothetical protein
MSIAWERQYLAEADRHIAEARSHVASQRKTIRDLVVKGQSTADAQLRLAVLERNLHTFEQHRENILRSLMRSLKAQADLDHLDPDQPQ